MRGPGAAPAYLQADPPESDTEGSRLEDPTWHCWTSRRCPRSCPSQGRVPLTGVLKPSPTRDPAGAEPPPSGLLLGEVGTLSLFSLLLLSCAVCSSCALNPVTPELNTGSVLCVSTPVILTQPHRWPGDKTRTRCHYATWSHSFYLELSWQRCQEPPTLPSSLLPE